MSERKMVPLCCGACGAPMPKSKVTCEYCRTEHEPIERYVGPDLPNSIPVDEAFALLNGSTCYPVATYVGSEGYYSSGGVNYDSRGNIVTWR